jgi:hypothetical protein
MYRFSLVIALISVLGCTTTGKVANDAQNRYFHAAHSWVGASIGEMIGAWGDPTRHWRLPKDKKNGVAWWESHYKEGVGVKGRTKFHCSTIAYFNSDLTITKIVVKRSRECNLLYNGRFESMTHDKVPLDHTLIET